MARRKHHKRTKRPTENLSVHDRPTLNPSAPPVALSIAPDPEDIFFEEPKPEPIVLAEEVPAKVFALKTAHDSRSRFLPMVKIVITACTLLIFAGGFRTAVARSHHSDSYKSGSNTIARAVDAAPTPQNMAVFAAATESAKEDPPVDSDLATAADLTKKSQAKLEVGAVKASIELGENAVRLDPTNARAWLVLGAAYQQRGDIKNAWRCYHACVDQGKAGALEKSRSECVLMLQPRPD